MIEPVLKDDAFLEDVRSASPGDGFALWWLGQSGFLVKHGGRFLLFDPYLSDSLTKKYADTDKPHERMTARVVDPARLDFVNVVTSSHNHTDHLDAETLRPMMAANPAMRVVVPQANRQFAAERLGVEPDTLLGIDEGHSLDVDGFELHGVPAAHEQIERDDHGRCKHIGLVAQFGRWAIYHSGDTLLYDGLVERVQPFRVDVAVLPINGRRPERRVAGNLDGAEAAKLARDIGARLVVPCHFEMFRFNTESPDLFVATCERLRQPHRVLRCGERLDWPAEAAERAPASLELRG